MRNLEERKDRKELKNKIVGNIKLVLFIALLIGTYFASTKIVEFLLAQNEELLKRGLNIILVSIVVILYKK